MDKLTDTTLEDISLDLDGGLLKQTIKAGAEHEFPESGDMVTVHYTGRFEDGTVFDSSHERGTPFEFVLGKGAVIKGWDIGVAGMKKGEISIFTCKPEYAYGSEGSPPKIPPNSTLIFEVELLSYLMEDVSPKKDGAIQKRILIKGEGLVSPKDGSVVEIMYRMKLNGITLSERNVTFTIGEGSEHDILEGVEICVQTLKQGETSLFKVEPQYAYGETGLPLHSIKPNAALEFEITLISFEKLKEAWELNSDEKLEHSEYAKTKGNKFFKDENFPMAVKQYERIVSYLESDPGAESENEEHRLALLLAAQLNSAACYLKIKQFLEAINACDKALEIQPENVKGLFRRGQAKLSIKEYDDAKKDFEAAVKFDPENKAAKNQIIICNQRGKAEVEKEKQTYKNMFEKFAEIDKKKDALKGLNSTESGVWQNGQREDNLENSNNNAQSEIGLDNVELLSTGGAM